MNNQSLFVKIVIWLMVFLMSVGFAALVISPFAGGSLFGSSSGRDATEKLVEEARADVKANKCADEDAKLTDAQLAKCKDALKQLASAYTTLARPEDENATELPRGSQRNIDRAADAYERLYELDKSDEDSAKVWASFLSNYTDRSQEALDMWTLLVKQHPKNEDYLIRQAGSYQAMNNTAEAISTLQLFVKRFPDSGQVQTIKDQIKQLQDQQKQQAAGGGTTPSITTS